MVKLLILFASSLLFLPMNSIAQTTIDGGTASAVSAPARHKNKAKTKARRRRKARSVTPAATRDPIQVVTPTLGYVPGDSIYCEFNPTWPAGITSTRIWFDQVSSQSVGTLTVESYPTGSAPDAQPTVKVYPNSQVVTNIAPYFMTGISIAPFSGEVPLVHLQLTNNASEWFSADRTIFPYTALWGNPELPGGPSFIKSFLGVCYTNRLQPTEIQHRGR